MTMPELKSKKGGRPRKYENADEAKAAAVSRKKMARQKRRAEIPFAMESSGLSIQLDPFSILNQAGPEGEGHITAAAQGIQADGLDIPTDQEQEQFLEVFILCCLIFISSNCLAC
jgi:hypothetical protein